MRGIAHKDFLDGVGGTLVVVTCGTCWRQERKTHDSHVSLGHVWVFSLPTGVVDGLDGVIGRAWEDPTHSHRAVAAPTAVSAQLHRSRVASFIRLLLLLIP